jgi:hypothetical protein
MRPREADQAAAYSVQANSYIFRYDPAKPSCREMFEMRKTLDARIHNNLANRLSALGYTVEVAKNGFRLREIPERVEEIYSVRNREIQTAK